MKQVQTLIISISLGVILSSCCSNYYYVNDPVVFSHVTKKSEGNLSGGINSGTETSGFNINGNFAINDLLFLSSSFTNYKGACKDVVTINGTTKDNSVYYSGNSILVGAGYYKLLGNNFFFEGTAGLKFGNNINVKSKEYFEYRHIKYFLQPGITYNREHFNAALGVRFGMIDYLAYKTGTANEVPAIANKGVIPYADPSVSISTGGKLLKIGIQISSTMAESSNISYTAFGQLLGMASFDPLSFSLFLRFTPVKKQSNK